MPASNIYKLFAVRGWGSALVEAMLARCGVAFEFIDVEGFDQPGAAHDLLKSYNPLAQVPTLILPDETVMTESAAIALLLSERFPQAGLAPLADDPQRPYFLRRLIGIVANIYPMFTFADYPGRWVDKEGEQLLASTKAHKKRLWRQFEQELGEGPWVLGEQFSALDIYVAVMTHYRPRRDWFAEHCPKLAAIAARADLDPILGPVLARNFG